MLADEVTVDDGRDVLERELKRGTLESKIAAGVFFCGEVVNVTGRLGGFNFQWAWSTARVAAEAIARR